MSGINGNKVTHDPSERLPYYLADAISKRRPNYVFARNNNAGYYRSEFRFQYRPVRPATTSRHNYPIVYRI